VTSTADDAGPAAGLLPPVPSFLDSTWYALARAGSLAHQRWAGMIADFDISPGQYKVLMTLRETGALCQQALAALIGVDPRNAVPIVESLAERGLIEREIDRTDRRRRVLTLSAAGRRITADLESVGTQIERDILCPLSHADQARLGAMLHAMLAASGR
jgi:MarR family transcriptional regulator, temperature-dependent positive regulator of motility